MINLSSFYKINIVQLLQLWQTKDTGKEEFVQRANTSIRSLTLWKKTR